jgi:hypothetical protein
MPKKSTPPKLYKAFLYMHMGSENHGFNVLERTFSNVQAAKNFICNNVYDFFSIVDVEELKKIHKDVQKLKAGEMVDPYYGGDIYGSCGFEETDEIPKVYDDEPAEWKDYDDKETNADSNEEDDDSNEEDE